MFPYHDENETLRTPVVTIGIIVVCVLVWVVFQGAGTGFTYQKSVCDYGLIPAELMATAQPGAGFPMGPGAVCYTDPGRAPEHILTSMFLHGGWLHLLGNMWFLWLFGNNIEDSMSRPAFLAFYLLCGVAAAMAQVFTEPTSIMPMIGASGAISGVMGAYLILYPKVRVYTLIPLGFFFTTFALPAWVMLLYWMFLQLIGGLGASGEGGVAFWAHVGGFLAGILLIRLFAQPKEILAHRSHHWEPHGRMSRRW